MSGSPAAQHAVVRASAASSLRGIAAMTAGVLGILTDAGRYERMRAASVRRASEFSADRIVPRYERLYEDVLRA